MSARNGTAVPPTAISDSLQLLGVRRLLLGIHDPAFPAAADGDIGRGSP